MLIYKGDYFTNFLLVHWGFLAVLFGFFFKLSAFPCHFWTPDVYEGCPLPVTAFFAVTVKLVVFALFFRLSAYILSNLFFQLQLVYYIVAVSSMIIGCLSAFFTEKIKRFIAYSTINHTGYIIAGLSLNTLDGLKASILYLITYSFISLFLFFSLININKSSNLSLVYWSDFTKLIRTNNIKVYFLILVIIVLSGLPPFVGFFIKYSLLVAMVDANFFVLPFITLIISTISGFYYLRIIRVMWNKLTIDEISKYVYFYIDKGLCWSVSIFIFLNLLFWCWFDSLNEICMDLTLQCKFFFYTI
jgi:NADH-quinone oxidoreductase subunit N